jgi:hypothetical protein
MPGQTESNKDAHSEEAAKQVASAHALLKTLEGKIGKHPEIGQAIHKLETALNILGLETGAML